MSQITKEHIDFMEEARRNFLVYPGLDTYRNDDDTLIALRVGMERDCIMIYRLDGYVANFVQQIPPVSHSGTEI